MFTQTEQTSRQEPSFSIFNPESAANPYPLYAQLRASGPIVPIPLPYDLGSANAWLVTQYRDAVDILKDARFTVDATAINPDAGIFGQSRADRAEDASFLSSKSMVSADGEDHKRLRGLVSKALTPR